MHDIVLEIPDLPVTLPAEDVIFPEDVIELLVILPADVIVPLVEILPVEDMSHCDVHIPTPVCAPPENPHVFLINPSV